MTTTVRLLSTYEGNAPQTVVRLPDALAASFVAAGNASLDLTGGINRPPSLPTHVTGSLAHLIYSTAGLFLGLGDSQGNLALNSAGATVPGGLTAPGAPSGFTLTAAAGAVTAAFTPPTNNGGDPELRYELTLQYLGGQVVVTGGSSPISAAVPAGVLVTGTLKAVNGVDKSVAAGPATATATGPVAAVSLTLAGPSSGLVGVSSSAYTVALSPGGGAVVSPVSVTPTDSAGGGVFSPSSFTLTTDSPIATFTYTSGTAGAKSISLTNTGGLSNPAAVTYSVTAGATPATALTISGPTTGVVGFASANYSVAVSPVGGTVTGSVTVTPSDPGAGGTFSPTSLVLTTGAPSGAFTYTPASAGAKQISITNNGGLTNPGALAYTATAPAPVTANKSRAVNSAAFNSASF